MKILVTAGNTHSPVDKVRVLTNVFTGRTGAAVALTACERGHRACLLTSQAETISSLPSWRERGSSVLYRTFEDLQSQMAALVQSGGYDAIIHAAAVSDYVVAGVFAPAPGSSFRADDGVWHSVSGAPALLDRAAAKIKSDEPELWLRLTRAPKLVDQVRDAWGFRGTLVKFKLEVGLSEAQLLEIAEQSRRDSHADWMVANTFEGAAEWAFLGPFADGYHKIERRALAASLLEALEQGQRAAGPDRR